MENWNGQEKKDIAEGGPNYICAHTPASLEILKFMQCSD